MPGTEGRPDLKHCVGIHKANLATSLEVKHVTYKRREMSVTKNLTLKKRTKVVVGTFFQPSGATLEILVSLSTKKNSLSKDRTERV